MILYPSLPNSPYVFLVSDIDSIQTSIELQDTSTLLSPPNLLTIGETNGGTVFETMRYIEINGNTLTVERGFDGDARSWEAAKTALSRNFTSYDHNAFISRIEANDRLTNVVTFYDESYTYFVGDTSIGWKCNRWDVSSNVTICLGEINRPITLEDCQSLLFT